MYQNLPINLTAPIYYYAHPPSSAVIGGAFYTGANYPAQYKNAYFFGDYAKNQIYTLNLDAQNNLVSNSVKTFASNVGGPVDFLTGPEGDLYFLAINKGALFHLIYSAGNQAPVAQAAADKTYGPSPLSVNFTSSGSTDADGDTLSFSWDFGDNTANSTLANPAHTYTTDGVYTATLTVTDSFNLSSSATVTINVGKTPPALTLSNPVDGTKFTPGDTVNFAGSALDALDGQMSPAKLNWQVIIQHCPLSSCHTHTLMSTTGASGSFVFPAHDGPFYLQIQLSVTNSQGLSATKLVSIYPVGADVVHALSFGGIRDYARTTTTQDLRLQQLTVEAWVKNLTTGTYGSEVISMGNNWAIREGWDGNVQFFFNSNGTWQNVTTAGVNIVDGIWHHIAATKSATDLTLYIDGVAKATVANAQPVSYNYGTNLVVGKHADGDDHFTFNGAIDELQIWNTARTADQIMTTFRQKTAVPQPGLLAYIPAEEA